MNIKDFTPVKGFESTHLINKYTQEVYSIIKNKILKGSLVGGYISYSIKNKEGKVVVKKLHRLMMETFNPDKSNFKYLSKEDRDKINLDNLVINHKDGNKLNNNLENLEWCTHCYNNNYGTKKERIAKNVSIKINQYDLNGNFIKTWNNAKEVGETFKKNSTHICQVCNGKRKTTLGFKWNYCREEE